jgi:GNAT superfamily N-acetyltransferase
MDDPMRVRAGGPSDVAAVLGLLDDAVAWLVAHGRPGQWGTVPLSSIPSRVTLTEEMAAGGRLYLAVDGTEVVAALALGDSPSYVPAATEPEIYIELLVAKPGRAAGALLLAHARELARARGIGRLRVDCYAGDDRALVAYYERQGFTATEPFEVPLSSGAVWPGQILEERLTSADTPA